MIAIRIILVCVVVLAVVGQGMAQEIETKVQTSFESAGNFQFHLAAEKGDAAAVKRLVEQGAPANFRNDKGLTALHYAAHHEHFDTIVEVRCFRYKDINVSSSCIDSLCSLDYTTSLLEVAPMQTFKTLKAGLL